MAKKVVWMFISCLMALSLLVASCGPAAIEEEEEEEDDNIVVEEEEDEEEEEEEETKVVSGPEEPKYGGWVRIAQSSNIIMFDEVYGWSAPATTLHLTNEELLWGDWAMGPAGSGNTEWSHSGINRLEQKRGYIAESFEIPEVGKAIFKIRKGVRYALNPNSEASKLVNGREVTADDVVFSLTQVTTNDRAWVRQAYSAMSEVVSITAPDKETVIIQTPPELFFDAFSILTDFTHIVPPEVVEKYGDMTNWKTSVGTGAFMLTDFLPDSVATLTRNPNYWDTDPVGLGKGNQLPYLEGVKLIIITDQSTRMAGLRTGKVDYSGAVNWEDIPILKKENPELNYIEVYKGAQGVTHMRTDKEPFNDIRVRKALFRATDFFNIRENLAGGKGNIVTWPICYYTEYKDAYLSLEESSDAVKELYDYSPEAAKELLAEAGYPEGFKTKVTCRNLPVQVDYYSVLKDMWAKAGIELEIEVLEYSTYSSVQRARSYDALMLGTTGSIGALYKCSPVRGEGNTNGSYINDPVVNETAEKMNLVAYTNPKEADALYKELMGYVYEQAWAIPNIETPQGTFWWPWIKNYHGEDSMGFWNFPNWVNWVWIDQDMKKTMGY
ncbi:ABC transporter substrate-binding protein [Chloroflexota bacterium]